MPRSNLPPTPIASTEIQGRNDAQLSAADKAFNLGPPAIAPKTCNEASSSLKQPQATLSTTFTLPPPPTRSRTIIQVKPKPQSSEESSRVPGARGSKNSGKKATAGPAVLNSTGKKQPSSTSVAGKRIARKTAHSVIERRRRSKMNEEFATLKAMIPACTDQEMHKLAILQASIDYLRYLEKCIADLKVANNSLSTPLVQAQAPPPRPTTAMLDEDEEASDEAEVEDEDVSMGESASHPVAAPSVTAIQTQRSPYGSPQSMVLSPAMEAPHHYRTLSYPSSGSTLPSPLFEPPRRHCPGAESHSSLSASTSPTIMPSPEQDQEATAALLMLNKDRRNPKGGRGMSVKDLLRS